MGMCFVEETVWVQGYEAAKKRLGTSGGRTKAEAGANGKMNE